MLFSSKTNGKTRAFTMAELRTSMPNVDQSTIGLYAYQTSISFVRTRLRVGNVTEPTEPSATTG